MFNGYPQFGDVGEPFTGVSVSAAVEAAVGAARGLLNLKQPAPSPVVTKTPTTVTKPKQTVTQPKSQPTGQTYVTNDEVIAGALIRLALVMRPPLKLNSSQNVLSGIANQLEQELQRRGYSGIRFNNVEYRLMQLNGIIDVEFISPINRQLLSHIKYDVIEMLTKIGAEVDPNPQTASINILRQGTGTSSGNNNSGNNNSGNNPYQPKGFSLDDLELSPPLLIALGLGLVLLIVKK